MATALDSLVLKAEKQLSRIQDDISNLQELKNNQNNEKLPVVLGEATAGLATLMITMKGLEDNLSRETRMEKRQLGKEKLKELRTQYQSCKERVEQFKVFVKEQERISSRTALLSHPGGDSSNPNNSSQMTKEFLQEREERTLNYTEMKINDIIQTGSATLDSLRQQKGAMKSAQRRVLDAGNRLGLSQSVMRIISRRTAQDRYIFYTGIAAVFLVLYFCWKYII